MFGIEEFLEDVDFSKYTDTRELFVEGYLPFAKREIPIIKNSFEMFETNKKFATTKTFEEYSDGLYIYLCRYLLSHYPKPPIELNLRKPISDIPKFVFNGSMPELNSIIRVLEKYGIKNSVKKAEQLSIIFGKDAWTLDNLLNSKQRKLFYQLEENGILKTYGEETELGSHRNWKVGYWIYAPKERQQSIAEPFPSQRS
jgi:hypothetical protein